MQTTQATSNWELYKRLLGYLKSYWKMFIVSVVAMLIVAGTMPAFGYLLKPLINEGFVDKNMKSMSWLPLAIVALFFRSRPVQFHQRILHDVSVEPLGAALAR